VFGILLLRLLLLIQLIILTPATSNPPS